MVGLHLQQRRGWSGCVSAAGERTDSTHKVAGVQCSRNTTPEFTRPRAAALGTRAAASALRRAAATPRRLQDYIVIYEIRTAYWKGRPNRTLFYVFLWKMILDGNITFDLDLATFRHTYICNFFSMHVLVICKQAPDYEIQFSVKLYRFTINVLDPPWQLKTYISNCLLKWKDKIE